MGTDKRDRQRANKALKEQQAARAETRQKGTRITIIVVGAIVAVFALVFIANAVLGDDDDAASNDSLPDVTESLPAAGNADGSLPAADDSVAGSVAPAAGGGEDGEVYEPTGEVVPAGCPSPDGETVQTQTFDEAPPFCLDPAKTYSAQVETNKGELTIQLDQDEAPATVNNFVFLARNKYFDDTICHRIIPGFVVQCGDPTGSGSGDPGYKIPDELPEAGDYQIGSIAMANSAQPDTGGSQFFIITGEQGASLPPQYSLFGEVTEGFEETVVPMEAAGTPGGTPSEPVEITSVTISTD